MDELVSEMREVGDVLLNTKKVTSARAREIVRK